MSTSRLTSRRLGGTSMHVTPVGLGCWPIAGMTSLQVNDTDSLATLEAALECGINFFDTAYCYGMQGESDRLIARALSRHREHVILASKAGIHWDACGIRRQDASPERLVYECEQCLLRLNVDLIDLFYLHAPDPNVPIAKSADAFVSLLDRGLVRSVGLSNCNLAQLEMFHAICPVAATQLPYNMLQRDIEQDILPWCSRHAVAVVAYWPLMKGLLSGRIRRDFQFDPGDKRQTYPMYGHPQWDINQDFLDELELIARGAGVTIAQLVVYWTINQPGVTAALCGAKRAWQIKETAAAMAIDLPPTVMPQIEAALYRRKSAERAAQIG